MGRRLYTLLLYLALPVAVAMLWWRGRRDPTQRVDLRERFGRGAALPWPVSVRPLWIHAVSVGEVQATAALVAALRSARPQQPLLLTMGTATGRARATALYRDALAAAPGEQPSMALSYAPFDLPGATAAFLDRVRPCGAVFLETELWPNLLAGCTERALPVAILSARVSENSRRRYLRYAPGLIRSTLRRAGLVAAQSGADRSRFIALGADPDRVHVAGNVKFDLSLPADLTTRAAQLRSQQLGSRRAWIAGSTHAGEEQQCLDAQRGLRSAWLAAGMPGSPPLLVLAPRHPERFEQVGRWLAAEGVQFRRRSAAASSQSVQTEVLLLDTLGELLGFYAAGEIAFVGGSLVPVGGHNLLEPAALGMPVLAGPHSFNSPDAARLLRESGALRVVQDGRELGAALFELFTQSDEVARMGAAGKATVESSRGAVARSVALLDELLAADALR